MRLEFLISGLALSLMATPSVAQQFDVICAGNKVTVRSVVDKHQKTTATSPFKARYRLDLNKRLFCSGSCPVAEPIGSASNTSIRIYSYSNSGQGSGNFFLDRATGRLSGYEQIYLDGILGNATDNITTEATCTKAAFSGMPKMKF